MDRQFYNDIFDEYNDIFNEAMEELGVRKKIKEQIKNYIEQMDIEELVQKYLAEDIEEWIKDVIMEDNLIYDLLSKKCLKIVQDKIKSW